MVQAGQLAQNGDSHTIARIELHCTATTIRTLKGLDTMSAKLFSSVVCGFLIAHSLLSSPLMASTGKISKKTCERAATSVDSILTDGLKARLDASTKRSILDVILRFEKHEGVPAAIATGQLDRALIPFGLHSARFIGTSNNTLPGAQFFAHLTGTKRSLLDVMDYFVSANQSKGQMPPVRLLRAGIRVPSRNGPFEIESVGVTHDQTLLEPKNSEANPSKIFEIQIFPRAWGEHLLFPMVHELTFLGADVLEIDHQHTVLVARMSETLAEHAKHLSGVSGVAPKQPTLLEFKETLQAKLKDTSGFRDIGTCRVESTFGITIRADNQASLDNLKALVGQLTQSPFPIQFELVAAYRPRTTTLSTDVKTHIIAVAEGSSLESVERSLRDFGATNVHSLEGIRMVVADFPPSEADTIREIPGVELVNESKRRSLPKPIK